jgi:hypothetical protein
MAGNHCVPIIEKENSKMIHAHRVIEAIRKRIPGTHPPIQEFESPDKLDAFANLIEAAEKFDFGKLILEKKKESHEYLLPDFTETEWELWGLNLVPLPSEVVWYEYELGTSRSAVLVYRTEKRWCAVRFELAPYLWWDCVMVAVEQRSKAFETMSTAELHSLWTKTSSMTEDQKRALWGDGINVSIYLTLMLGSKTTEKNSVGAPKLTNKLREKKGKPKLFEHTVVRIVPWKYITASQQEAGRTNASPRLHWRRSHLRIYDHRTPSSTFVEGKGWCVAIPRCLVGSAELGEVSHEYFVENEKEKVS